MVSRDTICKACDGSGLLSDDEDWKYTCTVCGGDGVFKPGDNPEPSTPFMVDEMNRTLE